MSAVFTRQFWNPFHRTGGYAAPHVTILGLVFGLILLFSAINTARHIPSWHQQLVQAEKNAHIKTGIVAPQGKQKIVVPPTGGELPPTGGIYFRYFQGTDNQGTLQACSAMAYAKDLAYEWSRAHHKLVRFSARPLYDLVTGGVDETTSISDYNYYAAQYGVLPTTTLSYGPNVHPKGFAPWAVERLPSQYVYGKHIQSRSSFLFYYAGAGTGAVIRTKEAIAAHRVVAFGMPWYNQQEYLGWTTGKMSLPGSNEYVKFTHSTVVVRYNDNVRFPDGERGGFLVSNSFGNKFGVDRYGNLNPGHGGYVWMSYKSYGAYAFYGEVIDLGQKTGGDNPKNAPATGHHPLFKPPFDPGAQAGGGTYSYWVHDVVTRDTHVDVTYLFNYWGSVYHVWPVGLVATALTESGLNQYANRCCIPGDTSYGMMQFTLETACAYGLCSNIEAGENTPSIIIPMAARYFANAQSQACVPWPFLYVAYNAGSGLGCGAAFYYSPGGTAATNFYGNFMPNYRYAQAAYMGGPGLSKPTPIHKVVQVFHLKRWCRYYTAQKWKGCPTPYYKGHLGVAGRFWAFTAGVDHTLGGTINHEFWHPKGRYMVTPFQHGFLVTWPGRKGYKVKVVLRHCVAHASTCR